MSLNDAATVEALVLTRSVAVVVLVVVVVVVLVVVVVVVVTVVLVDGRLLEELARRKSKEV